MKVRIPLYSCGMTSAAYFAGDIHQDAFAGRLRHAVALFGGASALARRIGRSEGAVRKWLRGQSEPSVTDLRAICLACGARADWLINGSGDSGLLPPQIREPGASYSAGTRMDDALLEEIMTAVDEASFLSGAKIAINRKSSLVTALYGLCLPSGTVDRVAVSRLMKLAV
jgi:transcriptional regulator with XRE-family HTH domain